MKYTKPRSITVGHISIIIIKQDLIIIHFYDRLTLHSLYMLINENILILASIYCMYPVSIKALSQ